MYYELGTMVCIRKDASPFVNHEKGIGYPRFDVIGEIVCIHPTILSYTVCLSKKFTLTFSEDDIYGLPGWMSDKRYMFHRMLGSIAADVHPFYYVKEFESYITRAEEKYSAMYYPNYKFDPKYLERTLESIRYCNVNVDSVDSSLKALEELNRREFERIAAEPIRFNIDEFKLPTKEEMNAMFGVSKFEYKKIIFSRPCTIILWMDGTKTMARTNKEETFDPEKGVAVCFMKRALGEIEGKKVLRKANKDFYDEVARAASKELDEELKKATFPLPKGITFRPFTFDKPMDNNKVIKVAKEEQDESK